MSRAFVKDDDEAPDAPLPDRPLSEHPNYVTPSGLALVEGRRDELDAARLELARNAAAGDESARDRLRSVERDLRYLQAPSRDGAARRSGKPRRRHRGVRGHRHGARRRRGGEPLRDRRRGRGRARQRSRELGLAAGPRAEGARVGDHVVWRRPAGALGLTVVAIGYVDTTAPANGGEEA